MQLVRHLSTETNHQPIRHTSPSSVSQSVSEAYPSHSVLKHGHAQTKQHRKLPVNQSTGQ
jgi:hypothetical protein